LLLLAPGWQLLLTSQQPEQVVGAQPPPSPPPVHTPPTHVCPSPQAVQAVPLNPQAVMELPARHAPVGSQQPPQLEARHAALSGGQPDNATRKRTQAESRGRRYAQRRM
jgi:hypothetical protein